MRGASFISFGLPLVVLNPILIFIAHPRYHGAIQILLTIIGAISIIYGIHKEFKDLHGGDNR